MSESTPRVVQFADEVHPAQHIPSQDIPTLVRSLDRLVRENIIRVALQNFFEDDDLARNAEEKEAIVSAWERLVSARHRQVQAMALEEAQQQPHFVDWCRINMREDGLSVIMEHLFGSPNRWMAQVTLDLGLCTKKPALLYLFFGAAAKSKSLTFFLDELSVLNRHRHILHEVYPKALELAMEVWDDVYPNVKFHPMDEGIVEYYIVEACRTLGYQMPAGKDGEAVNDSDAEMLQQQAFSGLEASENWFSASWTLNQNSTGNPIDLTSAPASHKRKRGGEEGTNMGNLTVSSPATAPAASLPTSSTVRTEAQDAAPRPGKRQRLPERKKDKAPKITPEDLKKLLGEEGDEKDKLLSGNTMNKVLQLLVAHTEHFTTTDLNGTDRFETLIDRCNDLGKSNVLIPIHLEGVHWVLCHVDITFQRIAVLDPLVADFGSRIHREILDKLNPGPWPSSKHHSLVIPEGWTFAADLCPQQPNKWDCGVYVLAFALHLILAGDIVGSNDNVVPDGSFDWAKPSLNGPMYRRLFANLATHGDNEYWPTAKIVDAFSVIANRIASSEIWLELPFKSTGSTVYRHKVRLAPEDALADLERTEDFDLHGALAAATEQYRAALKLLGDTRDEAYGVLNTLNRLSRRREDMLDKLVESVEMAEEMRRKVEEFGPEQTKEGEGDDQEVIEGNGGQRPTLEAMKEIVANGEAMYRREKAKIELLLGFNKRHLRAQAMVGSEITLLDEQVKWLQKRA